MKYQNCYTDRESIMKISSDGLRTAKVVSHRGRRSFCLALLASTVLWVARKFFAVVLGVRATTTASANSDTQPAVSQGGEVPLVRIDLLEGKSEEYRAKIGDIVYQTLIDVFNVPEHDRFHVITDHAKGGQPFDRNYLWYSSVRRLHFLSNHAEQWPIRRTQAELP
jgi:hypothetical protein